MWLSQRLAQRGGADKESAEFGLVTIGGDSAAVLLSGEARGLTALSPGGLDWVPEAGQPVVVLRTADGGRYILGVSGSGGDLEKGEVRLHSRGGSLTLKNNGDVLVEGRLYLNGVEIKGE